MTGRNPGMLLVLSVLVGAMLAVSPALNAQEPAPPEVVEVSEQQLVAFAKAYLAVGQISDRLAEALAEVEAEEEAERLRQHADHEMAEAVEAQGLTSETYQAIAARVSEDEALREEFFRILQELQEAEDEEEEEEEEEPTPQ